MISLSLTEIATATQGTLQLTNDASVAITEVCTDTRNISAGCLFIALQGASFDAHAFVADAQQAGVGALLAHKPISSDLPIIMVADTRIALGQLGAYVKAKIADLKCAAITGSNGKTTTKEMLSAILQAHCDAPQAVLATAGNFNNDIGLPLTLLRLNEQHRFAVVELGANHQGEIAYTSQLAKPDVALINNVMPAHLEGFGSIEGVAKTKGEIWSSLSAEGTGVVNLDAKFSAQYITQLTEQNNAIVTFSQQDKTASLYASDITYDALGCATFVLHYQQQSETLTLNLAGKHNISNALAAASMACVLGCQLATIRRGIGQLSSVAGRVNSTQINNQLQLIDDTYNANSASVKAAIDLLMQCTGEKVLIFADMGELGKYSEQEHRSVGEYAAQQGITHFFTVGALSHNSHHAFSEIVAQGAQHFSDKTALKEYLQPFLSQNRNKKLTILVKGSRGTKMEEIVAFIKQSQIG